MLKEIAESFLAFISLIAFIVLAVYLLTQDSSLVGPI